MTAAALFSRRAPRTGLRPINPRRDMAQIAQLLEICFAERLDASGRRMVEDMRAFGRLGWFGYLLSYLILPPVARAQGFVWVEDGIVVGNASLQPVVKGRWVLANVAVHPHYRRRGIGRAMVKEALDQLRKQGAAELALQVEHQHYGVQDLYYQTGFSSLGAFTTWRWRPGKRRSAISTAGVRKRKKRDWPALAALLQDQRPGGTVWPYPLDLPSLRPVHALQLPGGFDPSWVLEEDAQLVGALFATRLRQPQSWRFILLLSPPASASYAAALLNHALGELPSAAFVVLDQPVGEADTALLNAGFEKGRSLLWMQASLEARRRPDRAGGVEG